MIRIENFGDEVTLTDEQERKLDLLRSRFENGSAEDQRVFIRRDFSLPSDWVLVTFQDLNDGEWRHRYTLGVEPDGSSHS